MGSVQRTGWGLGWDIGTYDGQRVLQRPGGFPGYTSILAFLPERRIGVSVLVNGDSYAAADAVMACLFDALLARGDARGRCEDRLRSVRAAIASAQRAMPQPPGRPSARPSRPLRSFAGTYVNPGYGTLVVSEQAGTLQAALGVLRSEALFEGNDTFRVDLDAERPLAFTFDAGENASALTYRSLVFTRVR